MNKLGKFEDDILRRYINPGKIEKAPEGFTGRLMTRIQIEKVPLKVPGKFRMNYLVPVISGTIIVLLIISSIVFGTPENITDSDPVFRFIHSVRIPLPDIKFDNFASITIPGLISYVIIGIFVLTLFDRILYNLFHRERKKHSL